MPKDHFSPIHRMRLPGPEPRGESRGGAATWWRSLKRGFLIAVVAALSFMVLSVENTAKFLADVTASVIHGSAHQPPANQPLQFSQPASDSADFAVARQEPIGSNSATSEPAEQSPGEIPEPTSEILFRQFQAWAAEKDAQQLATVQSVQDPPTLQTAAARAVQETTGSTGLAQSDRRVQRKPNVRPPMAKQESRKEARQPQNARVQVAPAPGTEQRPLTTRPSGS